MKHKKKVWVGYFQKILDGEKTFELRLADWKCKVGDILVLQEWDQDIQKYTGREIEKKVSYVLKTKDIAFWSKDDIEKYGYMVMGLK